jgi:superfamily I DNA and/or RNA helicase
MMSLPYVTAVGMLAKERIVIAGDFQQLGPISLAQTELVHKWLHKDPFGHVGIDDGHAEHAGLSMLMSQRRMHSGICELVNRRFYQGTLITNVTASRTRAKDFPPVPGESAVFVSVVASDGSKVEQTSEGSRRNRKTADIVVGLVRKYLSQDSEIQIGVISPYRGQVSLIKRKLKELTLNESDNQRIRVGTVHAFQGSEADVIVWDLVDSKNLKVGRLFHSSPGNRLANVAITRAQGKLVLVGDREVFLSSPGSEMVDKFKWILKTDLHPYTDRFVRYGKIATWISS